MRDCFSRTLSSVAWMVVGFYVSHAQAQTMHIGPYLQDITENEAWILWETSEGDESRVEWGTTEALGYEATGSFQASDGSMRLHEVRLSGLEAATRYYYRVHTANLAGQVHHFVTTPTRAAEASFRFAVLSDTQIDSGNRGVYERVMQEGILPWIASAPGEKNDRLAFVLVPGDLVDDGNVFESWRTEFFQQGEPLMPWVPFYAVIGNHENDSPTFYRYFHQPENNSTAMPEQYWARSYSNARILAINSNTVFLAGEQSEFLTRELAAACTDEQTDFLILQMHHAYRSEYWPNGQEPVSGQVALALTQWANDCGKVAFHFHGHTHAYARGASRDARHAWVNVASAGGNIDYADEYGNRRDWDEITVSQDDWGFVVVEVTAGAQPSFLIKRYSMGNERVTRNNELTDQLFVRLHDQKPNTPSLLSPRGLVGPSCKTLQASPFVDADSQVHEATHWQVSAGNCEFRDLVIDRYRTRENWYGGVDLQAGDDLTNETTADEFAADQYYCARVRYRDPGMVWSDWSETVAFRISANGAANCINETPLAPPSDAGVDGGIANTKNNCGCRLQNRSDAMWRSAMALVILSALQWNRRKRATKN